MTYEEKERVYICRGITKNLKAYIPETENIVILCETALSRPVLDRICRQFPDAPMYTVISAERMKTFDIMEAIVHFLYRRGCGKNSILLIVGDLQLKELGGFTASSYYCGIPYIYIPVSRESVMFDHSNICGIDLLQIPDVLQCSYAPCMVFQDEEIFEYADA